MKTTMHWEDGHTVMILDGETTRTAKLTSFAPAVDGNHFHILLQDALPIVPWPDKPEKTLSEWVVHAPNLADAIIIGRAWVEGE